MGLLCQAFFSHSTTSIQSAFPQTAPGTAPAHPLTELRIQSEALLMREARSNCRVSIPALNPLQTAEEIKTENSIFDPEMRKRSAIRNPNGQYKAKLLTTSDPLIRASGLIGQ